MLTVENLKENKELAGLSDDHLTVIAGMSKTDEGIFIGKRIGEVYEQFDIDILGASGLEKEQGEKTYNYAKRVIGKLKESGGDVAGLNTTIKTLEDANKVMKAQIDAGGSEASAQEITKLTQQITDNETLVTQLKQTHTTAFDDLNGKYNDSLSKNAAIEIDHEFDEALRDVHFKDEGIIPKSIRNREIASAKANIKKTTTQEWIENTDGTRTLVFRDENKQIIRDEKQHPITAGALLIKELNDIIDIDKQQKGGGLKTPKGGEKGTISINGARTQPEALEMIKSGLMANGISQLDPEFAQKIKEESVKLNIQALPMSA